MRRTIISAAATIAAIALTGTVLTSCADPCTNIEPMFFNTEDERYHYGTVDGPLVPDADVKAGCAADQQRPAGLVAVDVDVDAPKGGTPPKPPAPAAPKQPVAPKPVPAPAPKAPAPKTGR